MLLRTVGKGVRSRRAFHRDRANPRLRTVDRIVGVPAVAALGIGRRLRGRRTVPPRWQSVGFVLGAGIGDTVLASAVLGDVRDARPDARIVLFVTESNASFARMLPQPDEVVEMSVRSPLAALRRVRSRRCDVVVDLGMWTRFEALVTVGSGARATVGRRTPAQYRHDAYDVVVDHRSDEHEIQNQRRLAGVLGVVCTSDPVLEADRQITMGAPYAVFHLWPGGARAAERSWPEERWYELARELRSRGFGILLTGGPENRAATDALVATWAERGLEATSSAGCSWPEVMRTLAGAVAVVSVNTGVMHIAAALGIPTIAVDGPTSAARYRPIGPRVQRVASPMVPDGYLDLGFEDDPRFRDCMRAITVAMVVEAWDGLVSGPTPRRSSSKQSRDRTTGLRRPDGSC
ncbi:MAG: glycosyltransferase family 9 protein [Actinobacteria bacterium]|nr:glycosyltransferase family 9 protein [Actinomycetota bacterium]